MTGKTKRREKRLKIDFGRFSAFALGMALLLGPFPWSVALAEDAYTITYDAGTFGMLPGVADDDGLPARTLVQTKQRGQSATLFPNAPEANVAYFVLDWQATVSANGGTFDDGSSERQLSGQIGNRSPEFAHWNGSDGKASAYRRKQQIQLRKICHRRHRLFTDMRCHHGVQDRKELIESLV